MYLFVDSATQTTPFLLIQNNEQRNTSDYHIHHEQILVRQRYPDVIVIYVENPVYRYIMKEHPMIVAEPEGIA